MLSKLIKTYEMYSSSGKDEYGQANEHTLVGTVDVAVSDLNHSIDRTNPLFGESTHLGLTKSKSLNKGDRIQLSEVKYAVEYVILETRLTQLFLKKV